jgi:O-antigen/teichoic acid export membrane protein
LLYSADVVLVKHFFDPHLAGIYSSLSVLGKVIFFASNAIGFVVFPMLAEKRELRQKTDELVKMSLVFVGCVSGILTSVYFLFPSTVVRILFGNSFDEAIPYLGYFGIFLSFFSLSSILTNIFLAIGNRKFSLLLLAASIAQIIGISIFHSTLKQVIVTNSLITVILFFSLLIYYPHGKKYD